MIHAYDEIMDFIAAGTTPDAVVRFEPSQGTKDLVADLIHQEKTTGLTPEESTELEQFMNLGLIDQLVSDCRGSLCDPTLVCGANHDNRCSSDPNPTTHTAVVRLPSAGTVGPRGRGR